MIKQRTYTYNPTHIMKTKQVNKIKCTIITKVSQNEIRAGMCFH